MVMVVGFSSLVDSSCFVCFVLAGDVGYIFSWSFSGFLMPGKTEKARQIVSIHRSAVGYILTILLLVTVIAVISEGLTRPL